jgi:hypothetical protein
VPKRRSPQRTEEDAAEQRQRQRDAQTSEDLHRDSALARLFSERGEEGSGCYATADRQPRQGREAPADDGQNA